VKWSNTFIISPLNKSKSTEILQFAKEPWIAPSP